MICPRCQFESPEGKKFCQTCGAKLVLICPSCSAEYPIGSKFCGDCGQNLEAVMEPGYGTSQPAFCGEKKQATVLFSDLLGYTTLSGKLDPEDVKDLMSYVFGEIAQVVTKYEGFIDKFIGDAVLAIFGIPKVHEDDPVRAIKAAREIHDLVSLYSRKVEAKIGLPLVMHTGIDTGLVVTGDMGINKEGYVITGDAINIASRLSDLAKTGEILVGPDTFRMAEGFFTFEDLGPTNIKGKIKPMRVYKLLSVREQPITIRRLSGLKADLIGRDREMNQLRQALESLKEGGGTTFSIHGDAGTGKSRLVEEFKTTIDPEEIQWLEGHAYAYSQNIPYSHLVDMLNHAWQIKEGDSAVKIKEKLESGIGSLVGNGEEVIPYIGRLYSLSYPELEGIDPVFWRKCLYKAMLEILSAIVQRKPTVIFIEDVQWADPSSLELIRYITAQLRYPALILYAYRPYFNLFTSHQITGLGVPYREIRLSDLSSPEAQDMISSLLKTRVVPYPLVNFIQEKAEGNPFYLEEVVNSLIESETLIRADGGWKLTKLLDEYSLLGNIQGVISARVDSLDKDAKRTLQEASVIGRTFLYRILYAATEIKEQVDNSLNELERLDLIRRKSAHPDVEYTFKHALTQEIVYNSLLKKEREEIHECIGTAIENLFPDRLPEFYESLAFHFKQSTSILKAFDYLVNSGEKSMRRYALEEAHQYFKEASELLINKSNKSKEEEGLLIDLLFKWAIVFLDRGDFRGMSELLMAHKNFVESFGDKAKLAMLYTWLGWSFECQQKLKKSYQFLSTALRLGEEVQDQKVIVNACAFLAWVCADLGYIEEGILNAERACEITEQIPLTTLESYIPAHAYGGIGWVYWHKGDKRKTIEAAETLLRIGQNNNSYACLDIGYWIKGFGYELDGDIQSSVECCKKSLEVSQHPWYSNIAKSLLGVIYVYQGRFQEAQDILKEIITYSEKFGGWGIGIPAQTYTGAALIGQGRFRQGVEMIEEAQRSYVENGRKNLYALSEYILGKIYLQMVEKSAPISLSTVVKNIGFLIRNVPFADRKAENYFNNAIEVALEIGAKGTLGTAYLDLGLLHKAKGRTDKARECLSEAIQLFEQCEIEIYLKQAREAMASL